MGWTVSRWWLTNTDSRKAYYQAFAIENPDTGCAFVAHWGRLDKKIERSKRPIDGGTVKVTAGVGYHKAYETVKKKLTGDYVFATGPETQTQTFADDHSLGQFLLKEFGASKAGEISVALGIKPSSPLDASAGDDSGPGITGDHSPMPETTARPEAWGSW